MKNTITKMIALLIIVMMVLPISVPIVAKAVDDETISTSQEDYPLNVTLKRDETNSNLIHITATSTEGNITDLKYVHQYIDTDNASYFEEEHEEINTFNITPAKTIEETFLLEGYGSYTVYAKDEKGHIFLARLTVNDPNNMPQITLTKENKDSLIVNIDVTSNHNTITKIKIAKKEHINDTIDFSNQGTDIQFMESNHVSVRYTEITEEGLYVVYAEDNEGNKTTRQIYMAIGKNTPITVDITEGNDPREVHLNITDAICNIVSVKVAKLSEIGEDYDQFDTMEGLPITQGQTVNLNYTASEDDTYVFCIEDEAGYRFITQKRITMQEHVINVTIEQDENSPGNLTITATNTICNIVEMKVAIGDNIDKNYFENNGESISIEPGREVVGKYTVQENCTIHVYVKDEQGYTYTYTKTLIGVNTPKPEPSEVPIITLVQNTENPKQIDVEVQADHFNVDEVKWAEGEQNLAYFETNGIQIGQDKVGVAIHTEFTINANGTYTVYAKDEDGNEAIKTIEITNIDETHPPIEEDTTPPEIQTSNESINENESIKITIHVTDTQSQIATIKIANGEQNTDYFEDGGNSLQMITDDKSAEAAVVITKNGTYTIYAEDEQGNQAVKVITITQIVIPYPDPDDSTPPTITGVQDGMTYGISLTPKVEDENLASITLTRNGNIVEDYQNGDTISVNGTYVLTAIDKAGNQTVVEFVIDIQENDDNNNDDKNDNNTDDDNKENDNTNTGNNNDGNTNNINNNQNGGTNNNHIGDTNNNKNTNSNLGKNNISTSNSKVPYAGLGNILIIGIMITSCVAIFTYIKYKKYKI